MLDKLTVADFEPYLNQIFFIERESLDSLAFELIEAAPLGSNPEQQEQDLGRRSFSVIFRGPKEPLLAQQMCSLKHGEMGELTLFLVPLGPDETGIKYEAVFT